MENFLKTNRLKTAWLEAFLMTPCFFQWAVVASNFKTIQENLQNYTEIKAFFYQRYTVGKFSNIQRDLNIHDFENQAHTWMRFPREGSELTPPHQSVNFKWKDYCPLVFGYSLSLSLNTFQNFDTFQVQNFSIS